MKKKLFTKMKFGFIIVIIVFIIMLICIGIYESEDMKLLMIGDKKSGTNGNNGREILFYLSDLHKNSLKNRKFIGSADFSRGSSGDGAFSRQIANVYDGIRPDSWLLVNISERYVLTVDKINYKNGKIDFENISTSDCVFDAAISDVSSQRNEILLNNGNVFDLSGKKKYSTFKIAASQIQNANIFDIWYSEFAGVNGIVMYGLASEQNEVMGFRGNFIIFYDSVKNETKYIESGFNIFFPHEYHTFLVPLELSPDSRDIVFQAYYPNTENKMEAWLSIWNTETGHVDKIVCFSRISGFNPRNVFCRWCPDKKKKLLLVSSGSFLAVNSQSRGFIAVVDLEKKTVIRQITGHDPKSIKWAPEGDKIIFLESRFDKSEQSVLYIFDLKSEILREVDRDKNYSDFVFIK